MAGNQARAIDKQDAAKQNGVPLGAVAQLGEHHTGSVGVRGSIPRRSTPFRPAKRNGPVIQKDPGP